jgi:hypothetical protein
MCETFREVAKKTPFEAVKAKLISLADTMEPMATKLYFKTQKGTEDMEAGTAESFCIPFYDKLEKIIKHVQTMKVRMT